MTPQEAIAELRKDLASLKDALCINQDEFGTHYADPDAIWRMEEIIETLEVAAGMPRVRCQRCDKDTAPGPYCRSCERDFDSHILETEWTWTGGAA